jgi:hypothetical protein
MKIHLHVERLVLEGVPVEHPHILRKALEQQLTGRLREGTLSPEISSGGAVPYLHGGTVELGQGSHPARLGTQIAGAVYRGIGARE